MTLTQTAILRGGKPCTVDICQAWLSGKGCFMAFRVGWSLEEAGSLAGQVGQGERHIMGKEERDVCVCGGGACACVRAWVCMRVWLWVSMEGPGPPLERGSPLPPRGLFYLQVLLGSGPWRSQCQELCQDAPRPWPPLHLLLSAFLLPVTLQLLIWLLSRDVYNCKYKILKLRIF